MNYLHTIILSVMLGLLAMPAVAKEPRLVLEGVIDELADNIRAFIEVSERSCELSQVDTKGLLKKSKTQAETALKALGYYSSDITTAIKKDDDCWSLVISIEKNQPIIIRNLVLEMEGDGLQDQTFVSLMMAPKLQPGQRFRSDFYESFKQSLTTHSARRGYLDAHWRESSVKIDTEQATADITLILETGTHYRLGDVHFQAEPLVVNEREYPLRLSDTLLERLVDLEPGDPFTISQLVRVQQQLNATGYFTSATVSLDMDNRSEDKVPVVVSLIPAMRHHYQVGVGYSTDLGPRFRLDYENRLLNEKGHQFSLNSAFSGVESSIEGSYRWPSQLIPLKRHYSIDFGLQTKDTDTSESTSVKLGLSRTHIMDNGWQWVIYGDALWEDFVTASDDDQTFLLTPGISASKTYADDLAYTQRGYRLQGELVGASESLGSDVSFLQASLRAKGIITVAKRTRFIARTQLSTTWTPEFQDIPASFRFFTGGDNSVRGYEYESIGPRDDIDRVIGGKHLVVASAELDYRFSDRWGAAVFMDAGDAFSTALDLKYAAGVGMRWFSPVGPVRVDLAFPMNDDDADDVRLHLQLGPDL